MQLASPPPLDRSPPCLRVCRASAGSKPWYPAGLAGPGQIPVTRTYPDQGHGRVTVTAIPDRQPHSSRPKLPEGRWLQPGETGALVLNQVTRANTVPGSNAGDTVQLIDRRKDHHLAGRRDRRGSRAGSGVYVTAEGLAEAHRTSHSAVNQLRVVTAGHDEAPATRSRTPSRRLSRPPGIEVRSAESVSRRESISEGHLGPVILILLGIALPLGVVGLIGLASTMSANVLDRIREFGVMHAIGARPKTVRRIVAAEGVFLAVISCLLAVIPALVLTGVLGAGLGDLFFSAPLPYRISLAAAAIWPRSPSWAPCWPPKRPPPARPGSPYAKPSTTCKEQPKPPSPPAPSNGRRYFLTAGQRAQGRRV